MRKIGILHPGEMGISVAASAVNNGHQVYWASDGRSDKTRIRAETYHLVEMDSVFRLCETCEIIMSVCPPHAAQDVAQAVMETGFRGLYLDANAIAPRHAIQIEQMLKTKDIQFVDGGIIGGPAWAPKETWLYLSGEYANEIASCFSNGPLETRVIGTQIGKASALKMCYAAYTKGTTALLCAILATAQAHDVREELYQQWDLEDKDFSQQVNQRMRRVTVKAWRFEGEMKEIASTFQEAGLPDGFHQASAEIYHRMACFKETSESPFMDNILRTLLA